MSQVTSCAGSCHNMPRPLKVDLLTLKAVSESRDVGYLCANFSLPRPLSVLDLGPMYTTDRNQMSDAHHCLMPPTLGARA